jgi:hypothetical protein
MTALYQELLDAQNDGDGARTLECHASEKCTATALKNKGLIEICAEGEYLSGGFFEIKLPNSSGPSATSGREQKLIDIMFEIAITSARCMRLKSNEEIAAWVSEQLSICGFPTKPCGAGWGLLQKKD